MPEYKYKLITKDNKITEGLIRAPLVFIARKTLVKDSSIVIYIKNANPLPIRKFLTIPGMSPLSSFEKIFFFRNLGMMLASGIGISVALRTMETQFKRPAAKKMLNAIASEIDGGGQLSSAMDKHPAIFPEHITRTVAVGEHSGTLSDVLDRISVDLEKNSDLKRKIVSAIAYPVVILTFMIIVAFFLVVMVLPQLITLYADLGAPLPPATKFLQDVGGFIIANPIIVATGFLAVFAFFFVLLKIKYTRRFTTFSGIL